MLATGFSREQEDHDHAEEVALRKLAQGKPGPDPRLRHATIYSSLVPCGARASRPVTCVGRRGTTWPLGLLFPGSPLRLASVVSSLLISELSFLFLGSSLRLAPVVGDLFFRCPVLPT